MLFAGLRRLSAGVKTDAAAKDAPETGAIRVRGVRAARTRRGRRIFFAKVFARPRIQQGRAS